MRIIENNKDFQLKNSGELEIFFLGTGTPFSKSLFNNNFIIVKGDTHILVDFGMNASLALEKLTNLKPTDFECIFPTHSHADHIGGLEYLLLSKRYNPDSIGRKLDIIITDDYKDILWNNSLKGGLEWNEITTEDQLLTFDDYFNQLKPLQFSDNPRKNFKINYKGINLEIFVTNHTPPSAESTKESFVSYGLYIDDKLLISCDTKFDKSLINLYNSRSDYIFHDCALKKNPVHPSLDELKTLDKETKSKMLLMHYDDDYKNYNIDGFLGFAIQGASYKF